jgi:hypothetical protein
MKQTMNKKTKILSIMLLVVFLAAPITNSYAFLDKNKPSSADQQSFGKKFESRSASSSSSGWLRVAPPDDDGFPTDGGNTNPSGTGNDDTPAPIGSGLWILLPLAMGYGVLRSNRNLKRDLNINIY